MKQVEKQMKMVGLYLLVCNVHIYMIYIENVSTSVINVDIAMLLVI